MLGMNSLGFVHRKVQVKNTELQKQVDNRISVGSHVESTLQSLQSKHTGG